MAIVQAKRAADLNKFFSANVKLGDDIYPSVETHVEMIRDLGITTLRVGIVAGTIRNMRYLYEQTGVRFILITGANGDGTEPSAIVNTLKQIGVEKISHVENPNEPDGFGLNYNGMSFPQSVLPFARDLWNALKSDPVTANIPIIGTSLPYYDGNNIDISAYCTLGNAHPYESSRRPEEGNYHGAWTSHGITGCVAIHGDKPIAITEYGYYQSIDASNVDWDDGQKFPISDLANAKYLLRRSFHLFENKAVLGSIYELRDGNSAETWNKESVFGSYYTNGAPKQSARALKTLIATVKDTDTGALTFDPDPLNISFSGDTTNLHYSLVQKANGSYVLAVWRSLYSYHSGSDRATRYDENPAPTNLSITLPYTPAKVTKTETLTGSVNQLPASDSFDVMVADSVILLGLDLTPVVINDTPLVTLYSDHAFNGNSMSFSTAGEYNLIGDRGWFNDNLSSLKVRSGYKVTLYDDAYRGGASQVFPAGDHTWVGDYMNDRVTTVLIESV